jgi:hypothetical protein
LSVGPDAKLDRDAGGKLAWSWKRRTAPLYPEDIAALVKAGKMKADEAWLRPTDASTGDPIRLHAGSVAWNAYRNKWVMVAHETAASRRCSARCGTWRPTPRGARGRRR